jgi:cyanate permease
MVWMASTFAAAGPVIAGMIADSTGSFAPIFRIYAGALLLLAVPAFMIRAPELASTSGKPIANQLR